MTNSLGEVNNFCFGVFQRLPTDSPAPLLVKSQMPVHSRDMPTPRIAENTTFAWKVLPVNMDAHWEPCSKLETVMAQATVKTQKMFPDGKIHFLISYSLHHITVNKSTHIGT
jgi:hypothetical protein